MEQEEKEEDYYDHYYYCYDDDRSRFGTPKPDWFTSLVLLQAGLVYDALSLLLSPAALLLSLLSQSYRKAEDTAESLQSAMARAPSAAAALLRRLALGVVGAAYAGMVLGVVLVVAVILGVGWVRMWVDEPVLVKETLQFDYTHPIPRAVFWFDQRKGGGHKRVPIGHTFSVSVELLMPESDFNMAIGVFQISVEVLSSNGHVTSKSSLPCMLRFRSLPIRLARTMIMSVPLVLGLTGETQRVRVERIVSHKEVCGRRTAGVRVGVIPRAGTAPSLVPQIYVARIVVVSKLPWHKEIVRRWKWTFCVWSSMYAFVFLTTTLFYFCKPLFIPLSSATTTGTAGLITGGGEEEEDEDEEYLGELLRKWRLIRASSGSSERNDDEEAEIGGGLWGSSVMTRGEVEQTSGSSIEEEEYDDDDDDDDSGSVC